jgi:protein required for attachment to host cells
MSDYCVVVTDGARARFFTLEPVDFPDVESGPRLTEQGNLVNPEKDMPQRELFSNTKTGRNRAPGGGPAHGYDDHRDEHENEFERRFARKVAEETTRIAHSNRAHWIVLAAEPRMLGFLRIELKTVMRNGVEVRELGKDLSKLSSQQVHAHLAKEQLLPARRRPGS